MTSKPDTPPRLAWLALAGLAVGLGAGPLLAAMLPLAPWTAAALLLGAGPLAWWALSGESRVARLDVEQGRTPFGTLRLGRLALAATASTLAAAIALVHGSWGLVALVRLSEEGPTSVSEKGITSWMGSEQGLFGNPGLQGSGELLLAAAILVVIVAFVGARSWRGWALALLSLGVATQAACSAALWIERGVPAVAVLDLHEAWPGWKPGAGDMALGLFAGLLVSGAGFGVLHALQRSASSTRGPRRLLRLAAPAAAIAGLLACWPAAAALPGAPLAAPAPYGRLAAVTLLAPASHLPTMTWQAAWFASVLVTGLLGAIVASQAALHVLEWALGVKSTRAARIFVVLAALPAALAVLLPGAIEALFGALGIVLLLRAAAWIQADLPPRAVLQAGAATLLAFGSVALGLFSGLRAIGSASGTWNDDALAENAVLAVLLVVALLSWWLALGVVAALRARQLKPPGPVAPAPRRTRA